MRTISCIAWSWGHSDKLGMFEEHAWAVVDAMPSMTLGI